MCLGIKLSSEEEAIARQINMSGGKSLEAYAKDCYSYTKGMGN